MACYQENFRKKKFFYSGSTHITHENMLLTFFLKNNLFSLERKPGKSDSNRLTIILKQETRRQKKWPQSRVHVTEI